jgi:hypothetical protein
MQNVRVVDDELCKLHKGTFRMDFPSEYQNISNNPFYGIGEACTE